MVNSSPKMYVLSRNDYAEKDSLCGIGFSISLPPPPPSLSLSPSSVTFFLCLSQAAVQAFLVFVAVLCVPWMLFMKPCIQHAQRRRRLRMVCLLPVIVKVYICISWCSTLTNMYSHSC